MKLAAETELDLAPYQHWSILKPWMKAPALHRKVQGIHPEGRAQDQRVPCKHHPQKYIYGFNGLAYTSFDFNWNFGFIHSPKTVIILNQWQPTNELLRMHLAISCCEFQSSSKTPRNQTFNFAILDHLKRVFTSAMTNYHNLAKPNHSKPRHFRPIFRHFWPIFLPKVPKSKWIWFEDTYPLNQWGVLSLKILVSPFDQFEKHHFGSADMWEPHRCNGLANGSLCCHR